MCFLRNSLFAAFFFIGLQACTCKTSSQQDTNKKIVIEFYDLLINKKDVAAASKYLGSKYTQHNPKVADGAAGLDTFINGYVKTQIPNVHNEIKHVYTDTDFVILHVHSIPAPGERGSAIVDIFRLEDGKIVEHWDVIQPIPESSANPNTMF